MNALYSGKKTLSALAFALLVSACAPPRPANAGSEVKVATPAVSAPITSAAPSGSASSAAEMKAKLLAALPSTPIDEVKSSSLPGFFEVRSGANYGYASADGKYLISGDLIDVATGVNLTEKNRKAERLALLASAGVEHIDFFPKGGKPKYIVTVFTDVDCGYCRKLHSEMQDFHSKNIGIRYLFFPRTGPNTPSFFTAESVWCSADRKAALTTAKMGGALPEAKCANPVQRDYDIGIALGLHGTPTMVLPNGDIVGGYIPAAELLKQLEAMQ